MEVAVTHDSTPPVWPGSPIVAAVVAQLRAFGDLNRDQAREVLPYWAHVAQLSEQGVRDVLAAFPAAKPEVVPDGVAGFPIGGRS
jgi:hypothetical protein